MTYDPWIDQHPLRIWDGAKLAERVDELGATVLVCEADFVAGEVLDRPLRVIGSTRGDPTNVDVAAATARGIPVLRTPGRNADGVAELTVALLFAVTRHLLPGRPRRAHRPDLRATARSPTSATGPGRSPGRTAGLVGLGAVGRAARWRLEGLGMTGDLLSTPTPTEATHHSLEEMLAEADVVSMHAAPTPETLGHDGRGPVRGHARPGAVLPQLGPGRSARPRRPGRRLAERAPGRRPGSTTSTASTCPRATR